jgi:uncharacterized membrane protein
MIIFNLFFLLIFFICFIVSFYTKKEDLSNRLFEDAFIVIFLWGVFSIISCNGGYVIILNYINLIISVFVIGAWQRYKEKKNETRKN